VRAAMTFLKRLKPLKPFSERNPLVVGGVGVAATLGVVLLSLTYDRLPFIPHGKDYSAYFAEAGGLQPDDQVRVSGYRVGEVSSVDLDGSRVLVKFHVADGIRLGDRTEAAVKLKNVLGSKSLELSPRGTGELSGPIPLERTTSAYELPDALGDLSKTVNGLNTDQLSKSLEVLSHELSNTPPDLKIAVQGVARVSQTIDERDAQLRNLLKNADKVTQVLAQRSDEVVGLVANTNALLVQLRTQSRALDQIFNSLAALGQQLEGVIAENRATLKPALDKLNDVLTIVDNRKERVQKALKGLDVYALGLGESVGSAPGFKAYISNLLPGQFVQPFIDAAFSDLGVDPATILPSQRSDPQVGQPGTPPLPIPFPRTGQGGEPRRTLPDAITGNPGDLPCAAPGRPGAQGCYPLRPEPPQPPPGGPPPGPPAAPPPDAHANPNPPQTLQVPAPGQIPPSQAPVLQGPGQVGPPQTTGGGR
jgi:phospholipid/cholesterol/gamma-HCH transport system substrate-binding protein